MIITQKHLHQKHYPHNFFYYTFYCCCCCYRSFSLYHSLAFFFLFTIFCYELCSFLCAYCHSINSMNVSNVHSPGNTIEFVRFFSSYCFGCVRTFAYVYKKKCVWVRVPCTLVALNCFLVNWASLWYFKWIYVWSACILCVCMWWSMITLEHLICICVHLERRQFICQPKRKIWKRRVLLCGANRPRFRWNRQFIVKVLYHLRILITYVNSRAYCRMDFECAIFSRRRRICILMSNWSEKYNKAYRRARAINSMHSLIISGRHRVAVVTAEEENCADPRQRRPDRFS